MNKVIYISIILLISSCTEQDQKNVNNLTIETQKNDSIETNSKNEFYNKVKSLENINFFIQDSLFTNNPDVLIEFNSVKHIYHREEEYIKIFNTILLMRKYNVKSNQKKTKNKSANIIQVEFENIELAKEWFSIYENSPNKKMVQNKPKTDLWLDGKFVYFIQTYRTPKRDILNSIKIEMI